MADEEQTELPLEEPRAFAWGAPSRGGFPPHFEPGTREAEVDVVIPNRAGVHPVYRDEAFEVATRFADVLRGLLHGAPETGWLRLRVELHPVDEPGFLGPVVHRRPRAPDQSSLLPDDARVTAWLQKKAIHWLLSNTFPLSLEERLERLLARAQSGEVLDGEDVRQLRRLYVVLRDHHAPAPPGHVLRYLNHET